MRRLEPARVGRPWGRGRFGTIGDEPIGELWVTGDEAALPDGRTLAEAGLAASVPLVKLLDVGGQLSIQVHPDDALAAELHGPGAVGKHEAWVVLEADAGATLPIGLVGPDPLGALFGDDERRIAGALAVLPALAGTVIDVPPGLVHAPGPGVLLYEIQQRSDLTYRIWDWGRGRPLHRAEARRALRPAATVQSEPLPSGAGRHELIGPGAPFRLELCRVVDTGLLLVLAGRAVLSPIEGQLLADGAPLPTGSHWLAEPGEIRLTGSGAALLASWR